MVTKRGFRFGFTLAVSGVAFILTACQSTIVNPVTEGPGFKTATIHKMLIVAIASAPEVRQTVEEEYARQLHKRDIDAIPSFQLLPAGNSPRQSQCGSLCRQPWI